MKRLTMAMFLALSACSGGHPAFAADEPEVCKSIEGVRDVAAEHGNTVTELTKLQFEALRVGLAAAHYPIPDEIVKAYASPAIDDGTEMMLIGVDKDGCIWGTISRSVDWFQETIKGTGA